MLKIASRQLVQGPGSQRDFAVARGRHSMRIAQDMLALCDLEETERLRHRIIYSGLCVLTLWNLILMPMGYMILNRVLNFSIPEFSNL